MIDNSPAILVATDSGTHSGPETYQLYRSRDGYWHLHRYHAGASIGFTSHYDRPTPETQGYERWVGPRDLAAAYREAEETQAAEERARERENAAWRRETEERIRIERTKSWLDRFLADKGLGELIRWSFKLVDAAKLTDESRAAIAALGMWGVEVDAKVGESYYRIHLNSSGLPGGDLAKIELRS
jgi:hypothetical protein